MSLVDGDDWRGDRIMPAEGATPDWLGFILEEAAGSRAREAEESGQPAMEEWLSRQVAIEAKPV